MTLFLHHEPAEVKDKVVVWGVAMAVGAVKEEVVGVVVEDAIKNKVDVQ